ncbi:MAG: MATE family efflux transporter [Pseudomonadales bacterium]
MIARFDHVRQMSKLAGPIILANLAAPILGFVDTAVIGQLGQTHLLGALALASMVFSLLFWIFGFLRMGTTAMVAQAKGRGEPKETQWLLIRAVLLGSGLGILICALQAPLAHVIFGLSGASAAVKEATLTYYDIRIWGAPLHLAILGITGFLLGQQRTSLVLLLQVILNLSNILLDLIFVLVLDWAVAGVAAATLVAEGVTLTVAVYLLITQFQWRGFKLDIDQLLHLEAMGVFFRVNRDIMIRTFCLISAFAWFTDQGARLGDMSLAANLILMQFVTFSAFFIDGFAIAGESMVGEAKGARNLKALRATVHGAFITGGAIALLMSLTFFITADWGFSLLTTQDSVLETANRYSLWMFMTPLISFPAYILDGLFIGTTRTREMRQAMIVSLGIYLVAWFLTSELLNHGLWLSLMIYYVARAITLGYYYPRLYWFDDDVTKEPLK